MSAEKKIDRKAQILQTLAVMLVENQGERITTAKLADKVGVSEAALYRHFPSKAKMYEGLIDFIEDSIFSRLNKIAQDEPQLERQMQVTTHFLLGFCEKNPAIARILNGDALTGEQARLRAAVAKIFARLETQLKTNIRTAKARQQLNLMTSEAVTASHLLSFIDGRISSYVRSGFTILPAANFTDHWHLMRHLFVHFEA